MKNNLKGHQLQKEVENYLVKKVKDIIGNSNMMINKEKNFMDIGVSSMGLVTLAKSIEEELGIRLMPTLFFEYQNIKDLGKYFVNNHSNDLEGIFKIDTKDAVSSKSKNEQVNDGHINESKEEEVDGLPPLPDIEDYGNYVDDTDDDDDIAVIGISGVFGGSKDLESFWNNIIEKKDIITEIPIDHFDYQPWYDPNTKTPDKIYSKWGSFIDGVDRFDARFFNISPNEAEIMDPQLRLLLQVIYSTIEDSGYVNKIKGTNTGMYVGNCFHDYELELTRHMDTISPYFGLGNALTMLANRPSYYFDLKGPSMSVDTACSASLVALHTACKALKAKECEMAFVAGANLLLSPTHYRYFCSIEALSYTGRCHTFDKRADGYVPGEGVASILIKPLKKAKADGDRIHAVIKGSAVSHGGYTSSLTAPSVLREAQVIMDAWEDAKVDPRTIRYIEAHGTGTKLGDPIEINGLKHAFSKYSDENPYCAIGSTKAHMGHAEGAAGLIGVIKLILSMQNKKIPAMPKFEELNPYIDIEGSSIYINKEIEEWDTINGAPRRGGVSSFGIGGAYAHVVVEEYDQDNETVAEDGSSKLIVLSARDEERLKEQAINLINYVGSISTVSSVSYEKKIHEYIVGDISDMVAKMQIISRENIEPDNDIKLYGISNTSVTTLADMINEQFDTYIMPIELVAFNTVSKMATYLVETHFDKMINKYIDSNEVKTGKVDTNKNISLAEIAYTLQTGRESMEERLAIIASSVEELKDKLKEYLDGNNNNQNIFRGSLKSINSGNEMLIEAFEDEEAQEFLKSLVQEEKLDKLARFWVSGIKVNWQYLYEGIKIRRVSLPTYPFAKERYWAKCLETTGGKGWIESIGAIENTKNIESQSTQDISEPKSTNIDRVSIEDGLVNIWKQFLGVRNLEITEDYIALGGNSIVSTQIINSIKKNFDVELGVAEFLECSNIYNLTKIIEEKLDNRTEEISEVNMVENLPLTIQPRRNNGPVNLSSDQERLWFMHKMYPNNTSHNIPLAYRINSRIDIEILKKALNETIARHEALRTCFEEANGKPIQIIHENVKGELNYLDIEKQSIENKDVFAEAEILKVAAKPFDLEKGPLLRVGLIRLDEEAYILYFVTHHIISDVWSIGVMLQDMLTTYEAFIEGKKNPQQPLKVQYADYVIWNKERQQEIEQKLPYWKDKLQGSPELLRLPFDKVRPAVQSFKAEQVRFNIKSSIMERLQAICKEKKTSLYIVMLAAFKATLNKVGGQEDIAVGSPVANRSYPETMGMVGFLANTMVFRTQLDNDESFNELVDKIKDVVYGAFDHQEVTLSQIMDLIKPKRAVNYNPLFQVMFNLIVNPNKFENLKMKVEAFDLKTVTLDFDIMLRMEDREDAFVGFFDYNPELFEKETIKSMIDALNRILNQVTKNPEIKLSKLEIPNVLEEKKIKAINKEYKQQVVITSTFTDEPLKETLEFWAEKMEKPSEFKFAPYNQVFQQLLDSSSLLRKNKDGVNVVCLRFEDWLRFENKIDRDKAEEKIIKNMKEMEVALAEAARNTKVPLLVVLCLSSNEDEYSKVISEFKEYVGNISNLYLVTSAEIEEKYPVDEVFDHQADKIGHVPFTREYFTALGTMIFRKIYALKKSPYKVIVLDCDNTLWKGVCGEVGPNRIKIDRSRKKLQEKLVQLKEAGMLLCLCSKNEEDDVMQVLNAKKNMPLKLQHLVAWKINWQVKSKNIKELARELNLGLDSFIFMDDNPVECAEVVANCPEVLTVQIPQDDRQLEVMVNHLWALDIMKITKEDAKRTEMYQQNIERDRAFEAATGFEEFLKSLNLKVNIEPMKDEELERTAQLFQRTNQFNTTTRRHLDKEIKTRIENGNYECMTVRVSDRFGDYGLVGVMLFEKRENFIYVDSFLLSCRVLGKGVEHEMIRKIGSLANKLGLDKIAIGFIESAKNTPAREFLNSIGAEIEGTGEEVRYMIDAKTSSELVFKPVSEENENINEVAATKIPGISAIRPEAKVVAEMHRELSDVNNIRKNIDESLKHKNVSLEVSNTEQEEPTDKMEKILVNVFKETLHKENIGINSNFFDLGGNSLLLVELSSKIKSIVNKDVSIIDLFKYSTVKSLASHLGNGEKKNIFEKIRKKGEKQRQILTQLAGK